MLSQDSLSAFRNIETLTPGDHLCCIYQTEEEHRKVVSAFVTLGLQEHQRVIYIVDTHTAETVLGYLKNRGFEIDSYIRNGQFEILSQHETYTKNNLFDPDAMIALLRRETEKALNAGFDALRVTGEMSWALRDLPGTDRLIEYENKLNRFMPEHRCLAICQYDKRKFDPSILLDILRTHPYAIIGTETYDNFYYLPPELLLGENPHASELDHWIQNLHQHALNHEALKESERRYRNLYNSISDAILVADTDRNIIDCNHAFTDLFGFTLEEIKGKKTVFLYADEQEFQHLGSRLRTIEQGNSLFTIYYRSKSGAVFPGETKVFPLKDAEENTIGYIGLIRDITERIRMEEELNREKRFSDAILETSGAIILMLDADGNFQRTNKTCQEVSGYTEEEFKELNIQDLLIEEEKAAVDSVFKQLINGTYPNTFENHWITKSGEKRFIAWTNTVIKEDRGNIESIISTGIDITERKRELDSKVQQLEAEIKRLELFTAPGTTSITSRMYAGASFRESKPQEFAGVREEYQRLIEDRLQEKIYKEDKRIGARLKTLAVTLGRHKIGPKDIIELHTSVLRNMTTDATSKRINAITEEGRLILLELMGYLLSYYRNLTV